MNSPLPTSGHSVSASLDEIKHNAEGNADGLKSGHKVMQQANINKYEPQQTHRLWGLSRFYGIPNLENTLFQVWVFDIFCVTESVTKAYKTLRKNP